MTKYRSALLAGVAALAIAGGSGFAFAQTHGGGSMGGGMSPGGAGGQSPAGQAAPSTSSENPGGTGSGEHRTAQHPGAGKTQGGMKPQAQEHPGASPQKGDSGSKRSAQGAGNEKPSTAESGKHGGKHEAQAPDEGTKSHKSGSAMEGHSAAPANGTHEGANARPENGGREGASAREGANVAPSGSVKFSERQRTTIKRTIIDAHSAPRADHVDFDVRVGAVVPRDSIHVVAVPETLVRIEPRWRGLLYFVYEDEIVVVNPRDMHIVAVVAV